MYVAHEVQVCEHLFEAVHIDAFLFRLFIYLNHKMHTIDMQFFPAISYIHEWIVCVYVINIMVNAVCVCLATPESRSCCAFASTHILSNFFSLCICYCCCCFCCVCCYCNEFWFGWTFLYFIYLSPSPSMPFLHFVSDASHTLYHIRTATKPVVTFKCNINIC